MTEQLALIDPEPPRLTGRQQAALEYIGANQPATNDEVGAYLHELRQDAGGRGHARDERCDWCTTEGGSVARRLRELGYTAYRRKAGWVLAGTAGRVARGGHDPARAPWPEGF